MNLRLCNHPLLWCLLFLALAELLVRGLWPMVEPGPGASPARNPFFRRGWPEHTNTAGTGPRRIVLIGNSQLYGREVGPDDVVSAELQRLLDQLSGTGAQQRWTVENWGAPGGLGHDQMLLCAKALQTGPELVILAPMSNNYGSSVSASRIGFSALDIPLLAGEPGVLAQLPWDYVRATISLEEGLRFVFTRHCALLRVAGLLWDAAQRYCDWDFSLLYGTGGFRQETYWKEPPCRGESAPSLASLRAERGEVPFQPVPQLEEQQESSGCFEPVQQRIAAQPLDEQLFAHLAAVLSRRDRTRVLFAFMPLCPALMDAGSRQAILESAQSARRLLDPGIPVWDLTDSIDPLRFYTFSHFDAQGHRQYARLLLDRLLQAGLVY